MVWSSAFLGPPYWFGLNDGLFIKFSQMGRGLKLCLWLGPPWFNQWFSWTLARSGCRISQEYSFLFHHFDQLDFCVFAMMHRLSKGAIIRTQCFMYFCIKNYIGTQGEVCRQKSALNLLVVYATDRPKAVVPVLFLFCLAFWFIPWGASCLVWHCSLFLWCFF